MDPRERNPQVPMDPRGVDRHSTWVQQQGEDWNHHPICIQGKKSVLNPVWKLLKLLSITLSSKNIILSNIETNSKKTTTINQWLDQLGMQLVSDQNM